MIPMRIEGADLIMRGNGPGVRDLHVKRIDDCCVSRWEPTPDELAVLNAGGSVELWVIGGQPAVALQVAARVEGDEP